jgi:hypothetical protein
VWPSRGTTRWRRGDGGYGEDGRRDGAPAQEAARRPDGRVVLGLATEGSSAVLGITPAAGGKEGNDDGEAHRWG